MKSRSSFYYHEKRSVVYRRLDFLGYPNYRIGTDGSIWTKCLPGSKIGSRSKKWKRKKKAIDANGYYYIGCWKNNKLKNYPIHTLVMLAFNGPRPDKCVCRHFPDRNPLNCRLENLHWGTYKENEQDKKYHGTWHKGSRSKALTEEIIKWLAKHDDGKHVCRWKRLARKALVELGISIPTWKIERYMRKYGKKRKE